MTSIGYFLSAEQYNPKELVDQARRAEAAGFDRLWISDHFHPWNDEQGESAFVWGVIGALSEVTSLPVSTAVTCPTIRMHPAILAQASATAAVQLDEEEMDIALVVEDAIALTAGRAADVGVRIERVLHEPLPALRADARRVKQILVNLLSNAVKFTTAGGDVKVTVKRVRDGLMVAVSDTGIGMAPEEIPVALSRFGQVDNRLARKFEGSGLGLPLSKRLAELHGGTLQIESKQQVGTTVTVIFPIERLSDLRVAA